MDIKSELNKILKDKIDITLLKGDSKLSEFGLDSLDVAEVVVEIEEKFKIKCSNEEMASLSTYNSIINLIEKKMDR